MEREYVRRGEKAQVLELTDVVAVRPNADRQTPEDRARLGEPMEAPAGSTTFEQDGWVFVSPSNEVKDAVNKRTAPHGAEAVHRVFVKPNGHVVLGLDDLVVQLKEDLSEAEVRETLAAKDLEVVLTLTFADNLFQVQVAPDRDFLEVAAELAEDPKFVFAEPVFVERIPPRFRPNPEDPKYYKQWHLRNADVPGADIGAESAWDQTRGGGVRIAIIDHGFDVNHEDLNDAVVEEASAYFTPVSGSDVAAFHQGTAGMPSLYHGTFCAGMALARAGNDKGGCGVANEASFVAIATTAETTTYVTLARAIEYAVNPARQSVVGVAGADVISCSIAPDSLEMVLQLAIDYAVTHGRGGKGTPVFWAVDNDHFAIEADDVCAYDKVIAVGSSTRQDKLAPSAFGDGLDFLAPGKDVYSTRTKSKYWTDSGTSFATPAAAGVAALLIAKKPGLKWHEVRTIMRETCQKIEPGPAAYNNATGHSPSYGYGRIDAAAAMAHAMMS